MKIWFAMLFVMACSGTPLTPDAGCTSDRAADCETRCAAAAMACGENRQTICVNQCVTMTECQLQCIERARCDSATTAACVP